MCTFGGFGVRSVTGSFVLKLQQSVGGNADARTGAAGLEPGKRAIGEPATDSLLAERGQRRKLSDRQDLARISVFWHQ